MTGAIPSQREKFPLCARHERFVTNNYAALRPRNKCQPVERTGGVQGHFRFWRPRRNVPAENHLGDHERDIVVPGRDRNLAVNALLQLRTIFMAGDLVSQRPSRAGWRECSAMLVEK